MANRNFPNSRIYTGHVMPVLLDCNFPIGAAGAVGTVKGPFIKSVTRTGVGTYQIKMQDNYSRYYGSTHSIASPATGAAIDPNAGAVGANYIITAVGNTNWTTAGVPAGVTPAIGVGFTLAAAPAAGTGRIKTATSSGIASIEVVGDSSLTSAPNTAPATVGAIIMVQCFGPTAAGNTALIATDPANGSTLQLTFYMSNSSITIQGE